jgi:hypothetical protein
MSTLTEYTFEIYKKDARIKKDERYGRNKKGLRFVEVKDFAPVTRDYIEALADDFRKEGLVVHVYETFVSRKNMMSGKEYLERYDTPYYCSPSSETFWSA